MHVNVPYLYLSLNGRIGRRDFWIGAAGLIVVVIVLAAILGYLMGVLWGNFITALIDAYPAYALLAKRFQDRDRPGADGAIPVGFSFLSALLGVLGLTGTPAAPNLFGLLLGLIAVVIALWILIVCGFLRGTPGPNGYGDDAADGTEPEADEEW
jgi:uncharacterized membrane protein YhaH (DUF805 family)